MRFVWLVAVAVFACGCGDQPKPAACSISCDVNDPCPDGTVCSAGYCAAEGKTCEPSFQRVEAGTGVACAVDQFQRWWCWGSNEHNEIDSSAKSFHAKITLAGERRWESMSIGGGHACAIDHGELWCWGRNHRNQVSGQVIGDVALPMRIEIPGQLLTFTAVSAGNDYTCAIADGQLFCWGSGEVGKLGAGAVDDSPSPQAVTTELRDWTMVATGGRHTCAISKSAGVHCWGDGSFGQLGNARFNVRSVPQQVELAGVTSLALGLESTCAVTDAKELWCWGRAFAGALGDPTVVPTDENTAVPARASDRDGWLEVATAERYACARRENEVWCWGSALAGGLGNGRWQSSRAFLRVMGGATSVGVGWNATDTDAILDEGDYDLSCAVTDGEVRCWGDNRSAQLARGVASSSEVPALIAGDFEWTKLVAGDSHACGIASGSVLCWGSQEHGQVDGVAVGRQTPCTEERCDAGSAVLVASAVGTTDLALGANHTCALHPNGVTCWGDNGAGQCGPAPSFSATPTVTAGAWTSVFAGAAATCTRSASETWCWGAGLDTQAPEHEPALDGAQSIALGADYGCALIGTGTLACYGDIDNVFGNGEVGTCGDNECNANETVETCEADCGPAPLTHLGRVYSVIETGTRPFTCGLRTDGRIECWGDNLFGQSGQTLDEGFGPELVHPVTVPFAITDLATCTQLSVGGTHACALCAGALRCWGDARHGELGPPATRDPITRPRTITPIDIADPWIEVTAGNGFTCGRTQSGRGFCWGRSLHGALGNGATGANLPVKALR